MREIKFRAWGSEEKIMYNRVLAGPGDPCSISRALLPMRCGSCSDGTRRGRSSHGR